MAVNFNFIYCVLTVKYLITSGEVHSSLTVNSKNTRFTHRMFLY